MRLKSAVRATTARHLKADAGFHLGVATARPTPDVRAKWAVILSGRSIYPMATV
jgi:hypothetical protein